MVLLKGFVAGLANFGLGLALAEGATDVGLGEIVAGLAIGAAGYGAVDNAVGEVARGTWARPGAR